MSSRGRTGKGVDHARRGHLKFAEFMKPKHIPFIAVLVLIAGQLQQTPAQSLVRQSLDVVLQGDDPSERFTFNLQQDLFTPSVVRLTGLFENFDSTETGVQYTLLWTSPESDSVASGWTTLLGTGHLPIEFELSLIHI